MRVARFAADMLKMDAVRLLVDPLCLKIMSGSEMIINQVSFTQTDID